MFPFLSFKLENLAERVPHTSQGAIWVTRGLNIWDLLIQRIPSSSSISVQSLASSLIKLELGGLFGFVIPSPSFPLRKGKAAVLMLCPKQSHRTGVSRFEPGIVVSHSKLHALRLGTRCFQKNREFERVRLSSCPLFIDSPSCEDLTTNATHCGASKGQLGQSLCRGCKCLVNTVSCGTDVSSRVCSLGSNDGQRTAFVGVVQGDP